MYTHLDFKKIPLVILQIIALFRYSDFIEKSTLHYGTLLFLLFIIYILMLLYVMPYTLR